MPSELSDKSSPIEVQQEKQEYYALQAIDKIASKHGAKVVDIRTELPSLSTEEAQDSKLLKLLWFLAPERNALNLPTYDMMDFENIYTEEEIKTIVTQLFNLELTADCNGMCPFCAEKSPLRRSFKGVTGKFSFSSIEKFIHKYKDLLPNDIGFYGFSDPFDYRDGVNTFVDVFKVWTSAKANTKNEITTSIPKGGQEDFVKFVTYLMEKDLIAPEDDKSTTLVRLSIAPHNISRIKTTLEMAIERLSESGYSKEQIDELFKKHFSFEQRFAELIPAGPLIHHLDPYASQDTPAAASGVRIGPPLFPDRQERVESIIMCAANYLTPGAVISLPVIHDKNIIKTEFRKMYRIEDEAVEKEEDFFLVPSVEESSVNGLDLPPEELEEVNVSRDIKALYWILENVRELKFIYAGGEDENQIKNSVTSSTGEIIGSSGRISPEAAIRDYKRKKFYLDNLVTKYHKRFPSAYPKMSHLDDEKKKFYMDLYSVYRHKADLVIDFIESGKDADLIGAAVRILSFINKDNKENLETVISTLREISQDFHGYGVNQNIYNHLYEVLSKLLGQDKSNYMFDSGIRGFVFALKGPVEEQEDYIQ